MKFYSVKELTLRLTRLLCQFIKASSASVYLVHPVKKIVFGTDARSQMLIGVETLARAVRLCAEQPDEWRALVQHCMRRDVSWAKPTEEYLELYRSIKLQA